MPVVEIWVRYRAHNYFLCTQSSGNVYNLTAEKKSPGLDLKWMWQTLGLVYLYQ